MKKITLNEFKKRSNQIFNYYYDYSKSDLTKGLSDKIIIICPKHGEFLQAAYSHLRGYGCKKCATLGAPKIKDFIQRANKKFNNKFDYSKSIINRGIDKVIIICPIHGEFEQSPTEHLHALHGCPKCAQEHINNSNSLTKELFISRSKSIHGNRYDYSLVQYRSRRELIKIICKEHGVFETTPEIHLKGCNCPECSISGWDKTSWIKICEHNKNAKPCVYIVKCFNEGEEFYKIGRTMRSIYHRFLRPSVMPYKYELITQFFGAPEDIFDLEIKLHRINHEFKYTPNIQFPGSTECFTKFNLK